MKRAKKKKFWSYTLLAAIMASVAGCYYPYWHDRYDYNRNRRDRGYDGRYYDRDYYHRDRDRW
jgi:hypothetical protein